MEIEEEKKELKDCTNKIKAKRQDKKSTGPRKSRKGQAKGKGKTRP